MHDDFITIPLSQGKVTIVSPEDEWLLEYRWHVRQDGYVRRRRRKDEPGEPRSVLMHREILGAKPEEKVDHANRNPLDNRRQNLRIATVQENSANTGPRRKNASGYKGVYWVTHGHKWRAEITVNGKKRHLGVFADPTDAARAYDQAAEKAFGEFAHRNVP